MNTYSEVFVGSTDTGRVGGRALHTTGDRAGEHRPFVVTLRVVDERPRSSLSGRPLEEEAQGERLEAVEGVAEVGELQLRLGGAVEEAALARLAVDVSLLDVLVVQPETLGGLDAVVECDTRDSSQHREVCRDKNGST